MWELKPDLLVSKFAIDSGKSVELVLDVGLVLGVKEDSENAVSISLELDSAAENGGRIEHIFQESVVDLSESA